MEKTALAFCISNKDETSANRGPHQAYNALVSVLESTALNGCGITYGLSIGDKNLASIVKRKLLLD